VRKLLGIKPSDKKQKFSPLRVRVGCHMQKTGLLKTGLKTGFLTGFFAKNRFCIKIGFSETSSDFLLDSEGFIEKESKLAEIHRFEVVGSALGSNKDWVFSDPFAPLDLSQFWVFFDEVFCRLGLVSRGSTLSLTDLQVS